MRGAAVFLALVVAGCTVTGEGVDYPEPVGEAYATREATMRDPDDRCGPEFIQTKLPKSFVNVVGAVTDGPFRPVCQRHDACYRLQERTQAECDRRMKREMASICASGKATPTYSLPMVGKSLCRFHAGLYYDAINNTYAAVAYGGRPGGQIVGVKSRVIDDAITDDEFEVCVDVHNNTYAMQEYDVEMRGRKGKLIDREPDTYETNVGVGETKTMCVTTNYTRWSLKDLPDEVQVSLRCDTPENFSVRHDMIVVDTVSVKVR
ncbi:hypothetical protein [Hyphomonas sp.]|jgi:hypothetical protein|uniref:hypothetical protein n=1 Tax=Hyphomonas sp. TaxID=87 RepID=UPI0039E41297